jgi:hypothetical protein
MTFVVSIDEGNLERFKRYMSELDAASYYRIDPSDAPRNNSKLKEDLEKSLRQMEAHRKGELKLPSFEEMMDEL